MIGSLIWMALIIAVVAVVWMFLQRVTLPAMIKLFLEFALVIIGLVLIAKILMSVVGAPPGF